MPLTFQEELAVYNAHLIELLPYAGRFVIIRGGEIQGPFASVEHARSAGCGRYGASPFLVKQVLGERGVAASTPSPSASILA